MPSLLEVVDNGANAAQLERLRALAEAHIGAVDNNRSQVALVLLGYCRGRIGALLQLLLL